MTNENHHAKQRLVLDFMSSMALFHCHIHFSLFFRQATITVAVASAFFLVLFSFFASFAVSPCHAPLLLS